MTGLAKKKRTNDQLRTQLRNLREETLRLIGCESNHTGIGVPITLKRNQDCYDI